MTFAGYASVFMIHRKYLDFSRKNTINNNVFSLNRLYEYQIVRNSGQTIQKKYSE